MRRWIGSALVRMMACRLFGQCWVIDNWNRLQWNFNQNTNLFISENASEDIVCQIMAVGLGGDELNHTQMITLHFKTHWGRVTHICVSNLTSIGPGNGLSPGRRQAIVWTNVGGILLIHWVRVTCVWQLRHHLSVSGLALVRRQADVWTWSLFMLLFYSQWIM